MIEPATLFLALFFLFLSKDIVEKERHHDTKCEIELIDPYLEYDAFDKQENNSVVEVLPKPCDTQVDRSS